MCHPVFRSLLIGLAAWTIPTSVTAQVSGPSCTEVAVVIRVGTGTTGSDGVPALELVGAPVIGGPLAFRVTGGPPGATGILVCAGEEQARYLPAFDATLYPRNLRVVEPFTLDANGRSAALLHRPSLPAAVCGSTWVCQAVIDDPAAQGGKSFTHAVRLKFGQSDAEAGTQLQFTVGATGGSSLKDLAVGDLDSDGIPDLVTVQWGGYQRHVYPGIGDGSYAGPLVIDLPFYWSRFVEITDLDVDGTPDLVIVEGSSPTSNGKVQTFLGLGGGQFAAATGTAVGIEPRGLAVGDLDDDGVPDVVVPTWGHGFSPGDTSVLFGDGLGDFDQHSTLPGDFRTGALIADMNGDGVRDIVTSSDLHPNDSTYLGLGSRTFAAPLISDSPLVDKARSLRCGDFNGDGVMDLVEVGRHFNTPSTVLPKLGVGDGTYVDGSPIIFVGAVLDIDTADLSGDGVLDLAIARSESDSVGGFSVLLGKGDGTFGPAQYVWTGGPTLRVRIADVEGDGDLDLAGIKGGLPSGEFITLLQ